MREMLEAAGGGNAPCGAKNDAEDEGAQGARVRERHGMRERPIPDGDLRQSHVAWGCVPTRGGNIGLLIDKTRPVGD